MKFRNRRSSIFLLSFLNLLRSKSIIFWWGPGFEMGNIQDLKNQALHYTLASVTLA